MNAVVEKEFRFDWLKWLVVVALVVGGTVGNAYFSEQLLIVRSIALVVVGLVAAYVAVNTAKGHAFWELLKASQVEVRRVVWPTRQEAMQTTMLVLVVVVITALILWGLDSLLGYAFSLIIG